jgi:hypothetical protein
MEFLLFQTLLPQAKPVAVPVLSLFGIMEPVIFAVMEPL